MEPLPNDIYQEIVDFQTDVNRPIDISMYREFRKDVAWPFPSFRVYYFLILTSLPGASYIWMITINLFN